MQLIDTHCHFDDISFDEDREDCLKHAQQAGIKAIILPGISYSLWPKVKQTYKTYKHIFPGYGLHPIYLYEHQQEHLIDLKEWLTKEKAIALGECGLDFYLPELDPDKQLYYFREQIIIAKELELPLIIHARRSVDIIIRELKRFQITRGGVVHSFSGSLQQAEQLLKLNFYLGFGGPITYPRANRLHMLVKELPIDRILLETDAPDQPSISHKGERNEPAFLQEIAATMANIRQESIEYIAQMTTQNALRLFKIKL